MKIIKNYISLVILIALLITSCSKEDVVDPIGDPSSNMVELTFGTLLNDLANRAMNKNHFDQVPTCSDDTPVTAVINFSYGGSNYEAEVDILSDETGYFTGFSESLKVLVTGSSTTVTLTGFKVYKGEPSDINNLIWIAPIESFDGEFDGYVENALPFSFEVEAGTKPYIDVEVLCFDRRNVNEYGYVFFDILPEVIYPLCLFVNYCNEEGRHWVANYAIDLYFGQDDSGIQLYDHTQAAAMNTTGVAENGEFYADPLCLVIPGPPANLPDDEPYLYLIIYPQDWDENYGDINNTPVPVLLTWELVQGLLNEVGDDDAIGTNEYLHLLVGECDGALEGDGTIENGNGNGGPTCDVTDPEADCNNNQTPNKCDPAAVGYDNFDCDGDGVLNGVDECVNTSGTLANNGCPEETFVCDPANQSFGTIDNCTYGYINGQLGFVEISSVTPWFIAPNGGNIDNSQGDLAISIVDGDVVLTGDLFGTNFVSGYQISITDGATYCQTIFIDKRSDPESIDDTFTQTISVDDVNVAYPFDVKVRILTCPAEL